MLPTVVTTHVAEITQDQRVISAAVQLRQMGLNVFPTPRPEMVRTLYPDQPNKKVPYGMKFVHNTRLHLHTDECHQYEESSGRRSPCFRPHPHFKDLFQFSNLGLMLGKLSANMVCLDGDTMRAYEDTIEEFTKRGFEYWAHPTSRGGHLLFCCVEGVLDNQKGCAIPGVEVLADHKYCVMPPSIHPDGSYYTWMDEESDWWLPPESLPQPISINKLNWLGVSLRKNTRPSRNLYGLPSSAIWLTDPNRQILANGAEEGQRNSQLTKPAYDIAACIQRGEISKTEGWELLVLGANHCIPPYPKKDLEYMFRSALSNPHRVPAREHYGKSSNRNIDIIALLDWADKYDWNQEGLSIRTDRFIFYAMLYRLWQDKSPYFRASVREVAELANYQTLNTISNSTKRMKKKRIIETSGLNKYGTKKYQLGEAVTVTVQYSNIFPLKNTVSQINTRFAKVIPMTDVERDVFYHLGHNAYLVWKFLCDHAWRKISEIVSATKLSRTTVRNILAKLADNKLVEFGSAENLYNGIEVGRSELEKLANQFGTLGNAGMRRQRHLIEREIYANHKIWQKKIDYFQRYQERITKNE